MIKVVYEPENDRSAAYDGDKNIGECTYSKSEGLWIINHTGVESSYGGQGIAKRLVATLVEEARKNNIKIIPLCPFARREFALKQEYSDVLARR